MINSCPNTSIMVRSSVHVRQRDKERNSTKRQARKYLSFLSPSLLPIVAWNEMHSKNSVNREWVSPSR